MYEILTVLAAIIFVAIVVYLTSGDKEDRDRGTPSPRPGEPPRDTEGPNVGS